MIHDGLLLTRWEVERQISKLFFLSLNFSQEFPNFRHSEPLPSDFKIDTEITLAPYFKLVNAGGSLYLDDEIRPSWTYFLEKFKNELLRFGL